MKKYTTTIIFLFAFTASQLHGQYYCDFSNCLFWQEQPETVLGDTVKYAVKQWSIDEWDNSLGCEFSGKKQCEDLWLEVYYPDLPDGEIRPLLVFIHGGGFVTGSRGEFRAAAQEAAKKGYVAATIDYRLCKRDRCNTVKSNPLKICSMDFWSDLGQSAYVAAVDGHNALRYLVNHADKYHIDPSNIIVGGHSAGGWTALNLAYLDQSEVATMTSDSYLWKSRWGALNPVAISGVFSMAGGLHDPTIMENNTPVPVFLAHGTCDATINYGHEKLFHCNTFPAIHGSSDIATKLHHAGVPYYFYTGVAMGHDISPMSYEWQGELERFLRRNILCSGYVQNYVVSQQVPSSNECALFANNPIPNTYSPSVSQPVGLPLGRVNDHPPCALLLDADEETAANIEVYPNPVGDLLTIESTIKRTIRIYDKMGVLHQSFECNGAMQIPTHDWPKGMLFLTAQDNMGQIVFSEKIIVK